MTTASNYLTAHLTGSHRGIGATSSPGRFSLALEKRPGDEVGMEVEVELKFQRRSCNLSFLSSLRRKKAPEPSLLAGYRLSLWKSLLLQIPDNIYVTMLDTIK